MNSPWNIDYKSFKSLKDIQKKEKKKKEKVRRFDKFKTNVIKNKKVILIGILILLLISFLSIFILYPVYEKDFVNKSKSAYDNLQNLQSKDLKNIFNDSIGDTISADKLSQINNDVDKFNEKVDSECNKLPPAIFSVVQLKEKLQIYCSDLKSGTEYTLELLKLENMVGNLDSFINIMTQADNTASAFSQLKAQYSNLISTNKNNVIQIKFNNTNLIDFQKNTIVLLDKIKDEFTKLTATPKNTNGGQDTANNTYKQNLSDIYKAWRQNVPTVVDKVSTDIQSNSDLSSRDFIDEYNKFNKNNKFGIYIKTSDPFKY